MNKLKIKDVFETFRNYFRIDNQYGHKVRCYSIYNEERTPSMYIDFKKNVFKCFSSENGGGPITLLNDLEYALNPIPKEDIVEFKKKHNINIEEEYNYQAIKYTKTQQKVIDIFSFVVEIGNYNFENSKSQKQLKVEKYLKSRKIDKETSRIFSLGFIENSKALISHLKLKFKINDDYLRKIGILEYKGYSLENRIIIPVYDRSGNIVNLIGRAIDDSNDKYKKLKSLEEEKFEKIEMNRVFLFPPTGDSKHLEENEVILVEGQFDMIQLAKKGIENTIALAGKNLTEKQLEFLTTKHYYANFNRIIIMLDKDVEIKNRINMFRKLIKADVQMINEFKYNDKYQSVNDPDELIVKFDEFNKQELVKNIRPIYEESLQYLTELFSLYPKESADEFIKENKYFAYYITDEKINRILKKLEYTRKNDYLYILENMKNLDENQFRNILILKNSKKLNLEYKYIAHLLSEVEDDKKYIKKLQDYERTLISFVNRKIMLLNNKNYSMYVNSVDEYSDIESNIGKTIINVNKGKTVYLRITLNYLDDDILYERRINNLEKERNLRNDWVFFYYDNDVNLENLKNKIVEALEGTNNEQDESF